jgi:hypothetical protein
MYQCSKKYFVWSKIYSHQNPTFASIMYQYSKKKLFVWSKIKNDVAKEGYTHKTHKLAGDLTGDLTGDIVAKKTMLLQQN